MTATMEQFLAAFSDELAVKVAEKLLEGLPAPDRLLSVDQVAERLGVGERTVRALKKEGRIAHVMIEGSVRFEASAVETYLASRRVSARRVAS